MTVALLLLIASAAYLVNAGPAILPVELEDHPYQRFIEFFDGVENMRFIDLEEEPDMELLEEIENNIDNQYFLFTRRNPTTAQNLIINDAISIHSSNFNPAVPTVVIVHGWLGNQNADINPIIRNAYLGKSDVNIIVMDWRRLALSGYVTATLGVPAIGRGLGRFLAFLNSVTGTEFDQMHLVGFSLGAHVVGNAGREIGGRAARVTGLDPAGPLWHFNSNKINENDGIYVEAIHTDGKIGVGFGIDKVVANVDFFVNGGYSQPGCFTGTCNHNRSWELFAATVSYNHLIGNECTSILQVELNICRGKQFPMGNDILNKSGSGMYRVNTGKSYPF